MSNAHIVVVYDGSHQRITAAYGPFLDKDQADRWADRWVVNRNWSSLPLWDRTFTEELKVPA